MSEKRGCFSIIGKFLDDWAVDGGLVFAQFLGTLATLLLSDEVSKQLTKSQEYVTAIQSWGFRAALLFLGVQFILSVFIIRRGKQMRKLENENEKFAGEVRLFSQNVRLIVEGYLMTVATNMLKFDNSDRISLYSHDEVDKVFVNAGRFALNPKYREVHRETFPDSHGCIAKAWEFGTFLMDGSPDLNSDLSGYLSWHETTGIPVRTAQELTMKSRQYYGCAIYDKQRRKALAVIIVESTQPNRFTREQLDKIFNVKEVGFLSDLVVTLSHIFQGPVLQERRASNMANLKDAVAYLLDKYPFKDELSNARVTKLVYLADWHHAITSGKQMTSINWFFDNYGPFVWDVKNMVEENKEVFKIENTVNHFGTAKTVFKLNDATFKPVLNESERRSLDHVVEKTKHLNWDSFIQLVYSTYPILTSPRYSGLDLTKKAEEYVQKKQAS